MRLIRMCALVTLLALNPICNALAGADGTPAAPAESEEQDDNQAEDNEEPGCD